MIIVTNDDGYTSEGISILHRAAKKVFGEKNVTVVAPDGPRSASGMSLTFHKPLRIERIKINGSDGYSVSGTPADCIFIAANYLFKDNVNLILSGINHGMNAGIEAVYSSGTVSAVVYGAIIGIPGIAFSKHGDKPYKDKNEEKVLIEKLVLILNKIKKEGFPKDIQILNINFPKEVHKKTKIKVAKFESRVFDCYVKVNKDPRNKEYYWIFGDIKKDLNKEYDVASILRGNITITPMRLSVSTEEEIEKTREIFDDL